MKGCDKIPKVKKYLIGQCGIPRVLDLTGERFGLLTAIKLHDQRGRTNGAARWECKCDCGNSKVVARDHLQDGGTKSCGCLQNVPQVEKRRQRETEPRECNACHKLKQPHEYETWTRLKCKICAHLHTTYGITPQNYEAMLLSQRNGCAICGHELLPTRKKQHVDHSHKEGFVRGIICPQCNHLIGCAREDQFILHSAIRYLQSQSKGYRRSS